MAEFVSKSIEDMLPEMERLERVRLFSKEEIRTILKKRQRLEYRLRKKTRQQMDYIRYIQYERSVLALIKKRRKLVGYNFKKERIEVPIIQRIHKLFQLCQTRFPESLDVWLQHIEFSKQRKDYRHVSRTFASMLRIMNKNPEIWVKAAQWEASQSNLDMARSLMQRGISFNTSSRFLWTEFYKMELTATDMLKKGSVITDQTTVNDPALDGKIAEIILRNAVREFPGDIQILTDLMEACKNFEFARSHLDFLITELKEKFHAEPAMWNTLARHLLPTKFGEILPAVTVEEEERCFTIYRQGVLEAPGEEIWTLYLKTCLQLLALPAKSKRREKRLSRALEVFSAASEATVSQRRCSLNGCSC
ncbi:U3 small nucleolar RNA-associated protein 6 homolog [Pomacea canaliculata]|uniref:U3 small nucleolar RNA-associated protein 6 homolog n=1 Tax=Pomacea canaliculata TaxID=400727 RepID=UPI000D739BC1|nr:U3 small nucleolar RNA-associated protein 6 homolog [Pomacea canaliculata]XP_025080678.1 U3 small nucleolar RNA-associated protein 6 homolog [Pomacea canaliculata]XP_025080688.1 U3 small nucleolar RNA-associated protein 6 homolog [Pomacea canaliculata]